MIKQIGAIAMALVLAGCSVPQVLVEKTGHDLDATIRIAEKYNKPEVAKCASFLKATLDGQDSARAKLDELLKEPTDGILSAALKAALIAEFGKSLADGNKAKFEADFKTNCNAVAGDIMINLLQDAARVGAKVK